MRALRNFNARRFVPQECAQVLALRGFAAAPSKLQAIKDLREKSGSPMQDVKAALEEADYDLENAYQVLRKRGLAAASKKASRHAAEGLIGLAYEGNTAALVEINSETDFVAGNDQFRSLVSAAAQAALSLQSNQHAEGSKNHELDVHSLASQQLSPQSSLQDQVSEVAGSVRENIRLRRAFGLTARNGVVSSYLHISPAPGLGRIGTLVALENPSGPIPKDKQDEVQRVGVKLAMHAAATSPIALDKESVPEGALEDEKNVLREQAAKSGKPASIIEKMIMGRMNKFYEERCFLDQSFVMDETQKVRGVVKSLSESIGLPLNLTGFVRLQVGEGLEREEQLDFASEVQQTLSASA